MANSYATSTQLVTVLTGTERVVIDNGGSVIAETTTQAIVNLVSQNGLPFGNGGAVAGVEGNINRQISSAGVSPAATGADKVIAVYSLPANSLVANGQGLNIIAQGSFAANGNTKDVKIIFGCTTAVVGSTVTGGTTIADTAAVTTNGGGWAIEANVFKYGAANSNTQIGLHQQVQVGGAVAALLAPGLTTATENAPILIAITGNATTSAADIVLNFLEINAMN